MEARTTVIGCLYWAVVLTYYFTKFLGSPGGIPPSLYGFAPFVVVFVLAAVGVWMKPKAGFITAVAISGVSLLLVGPNLGIAEAPSAEGLLTGGATANGILFVVLFFSLFGASNAWRKGPEAPSFKLGKTAAVGALVFLVILVALGAAFGSGRGGFSNTDQADVVIAPGSAYIPSSQFYLPQTFDAKVGQTVIWKNLDTASHTITSDSGLFQSGNLDAGKTYSYTFSQPGTYHYTCDYHPWMTGTIAVTNG